MKNLVQIRLAEPKDSKGLANLYRHLDSCNGSASMADAVIKETRESVMSREFKSLALVAETLDEETLAPTGLVSTGRLILLGATGDSAPLMYENTTDGMKLVKREGDAALEMAAMVTDPAFRGHSIGKAMTAVRALIARNFSGFTGTDRLLVEFLPPYDDPITKENAFWRDLIVPHLEKDPQKTASLKSDCEKMTSTPVNTMQDVLKVLLKLDPVQRNLIVEKYFPHLIPNDGITAAARHITEEVGKNTKGALLNLQRLYGSGTFNKTGNFAIDGGPNYETLAMYGALGDKTVQAGYTDGSVEDAKIMAETPNRLLVWKPRPNTQRELRSANWVMTPGILGPKVAKLPRDIAQITNIAQNEAISVFNLPRSSSK